MAHDPESILKHAGCRRRTSRPRREPYSCTPTLAKSSIGATSRSLRFVSSVPATTKLYRTVSPNVSVSGRYVPGLGRYGREIHSRRYTGEYPTRPSHFPVRTGRYGTYRPIFRTLIQTPISKDGLEWIWKKMIETGKTGFVFNPYGGKMSEIPASETPFPHRAGNICKVQYSVNWSDEAEDADKNYMNQIRRLYSYMTPFVSKSPRGAFLNYRDLDIGVTDNGKDRYEDGVVYGQKYFMGNFDRLVKVKSMVDPENFFRNEQSIPPIPS